MIVAVALATTAGYMGVPRVVFDSITERRVDGHGCFPDDDVEAIDLVSADSVPLRAWVMRPDSVARVVVTLAGISDTSATMFAAHARAFREHAIATVMLDLRAHGCSGGYRIGLGYTDWRDVAAAVGYIAADPLLSGKPVTVMGVSMGGAVAINSGALVEGVDRIITMSGYSSVDDLIALHASAHGAPRPMIDDFVDAWNSEATAVYGVDTREITPKRMIERLAGKNVLLIHSHDDSVVPFACRDSLLAHADAATVDTLTIAGNRHMILDDFSRPADNQPYLTTLIDFITR